VAEVDLPTPGPAPTVFLSYASGDRDAARTLRDALRTLGLEVWYDESELGGGEAWDQKIRKQIRECDYFMPLISAQTEARSEGYFRREWRLAVERTLDMADDHAFLLPVALDETRQSGARVPEKFLSVQWIRAPGGQSSPALEALGRRLLSGEPAPAQRTGSVPARPAGPSVPPEPEAPPPSYPEFPKEGTGSKTHYWLQVIVWALRSGWIFFKQLPRWIRVFISIWLFVVLISRGCSSDERAPRASRLPSPDAKELRAITDKYHGNFDKSDISKLATQIAKLTSENGEVPAEKSPLLAIPFTAPSGNPEAAKLADSTFALVYGKIAIAHRGGVGVSKDSVSCDDSKAALERGRANHSNYVLCGAIDATPPALSIKLTKVDDGTVIWSKAYPVAGADPAGIAEEVNSHVPTLDDD
jgi:TIR domain